MNHFAATYLARFVGILFVIPAIFPSWFQNQFPGLEDRRITMLLFVIGVAIYIGASIAYHILRKKDIARHRAEMDELEKKV